MSSVPNHSPGVFASASAGRYGRFVDGGGERVYRHDELGYHDHLLSSVALLPGVEGEAPVPSANVFYSTQARGENVRHAEQFEQFLTFLHNAPQHPKRGALIALALGEAMAFRLRYPSAASRGFHEVNTPKQEQAGAA